MGTLSMKSVVSRVDLPARSEVLDKLRALASGNCSPEEVSRWATAWLIADHTLGKELRIVDWPVWQALIQLAGADLLVGPRAYLHSTEDFNAWLAGLDS